MVHGHINNHRFFTLPLQNDVNWHSLPSHPHIVPLHCSLRHKFPRTRYLILILQWIILSNYLSQHHWHRRIAPPLPALEPLPSSIVACPPTQSRSYPSGANNIHPLFALSCQPTPQAREQQAAATSTRQICPPSLPLPPSPLERRVRAAPRSLAAGPP